jgi:hypothetical protein
LAIVFVRYKDSQIVSVLVVREDKESEFFRVIPFCRARKLFPVTEARYHLAAVLGRIGAGRVGVFRIACKIPHKENSLQVFYQNINARQLSGGAVRKKPKAVLERRKIKDVSFEVSPVEKGYDGAIHFFDGDWRRRH